MILVVIHFNGLKIKGRTIWVRYANHIPNYWPQSALGEGLWCSEMVSKFMTNPHLKSRRENQKKRERFALPLNSWEVQWEHVPSHHWGTRLQRERATYTNSCQLGIEWGAAVRTLSQEVQRGAETLSQLPNTWTGGHYEAEDPARNKKSRKT